MADYDYDEAAYDDYDMYDMMQQQQYADYGDDPSGMAEDFSYMGHLENCVLPTISQGVQIVLPLLMLCIGMKITSVFCKL